MNRHQVLTGSCNPGDNCYAVGSVEGVHFTAYAAGCNIVILAGNFERVQIIPGVAHGNIKVTCIDCSTDTGKIAASYGKKVYIFEPTPLVNESSHRLDYRWYKTAEIETECYINNLSWNMEGSKLLTGGELIQIWQLTPEKGGQGDTETEEPGTKRVHFSLGDSSIAGSGDPEEDAFTQRLSHVLDPAHHGLVHDPGSWQCVWKCRPATPVYHLQFSPDGFLFASAGKADRLVKIWYEDQKVQRGLSRSDSISPKRDTLHYSFVYISHPRAVTGFTWRRTSKYMPRGAVANMLVTSCLDNVCRIWVETILPDDGLVDLEQVEPSLSHDLKHHAHRHKKRFLQRLRTIRGQGFPDPAYAMAAKYESLRHAIHKRRKHKYGPETVMSANALNSMGSVHDFHRFAIHHNGVSPVLHFHLAGSINPYTDIPLSPVSGNQYTQHNFRLHWLDNKELQFTMEAERLLQELHTKLVHEDTEQGAGAHLGGDETGDSDEHDEDGDGDHEQNFASFGQETYDKDDDLAKKKKHKLFKRKKLSKGESNKTVVQSDSQTSLSSEHDSEGHGEISGSILERLDHNIEMLLKEWQSTSDMLFSIHPVDGSFLVWLVEWLDEGLPFTFRQAQISFSSCLPRAIPVPDAATMSCNLLLYCNYSRMDIKSVMHISEEEEGAVSASNAAGVRNNHIGVNSMDMLIPNVLLVSKHNNGTLNQWQISFTESSKFQTVVSVAHAARVCGHRFRANAAACHPVLPLLLTTSHHNLPDPDTTPERETSPEEEDGDAGKSLGAGVFAFCSELILWQVNSVGPLSKSGGLVELARINSPSTTAFTSMAWVPTLLPSTTLGSCSNSPSALFVASDGASLRLYQAVIDARALLTESKPAPNEQTFSFSSASSSYCPDPGSPPQPLSQIFHVASLQSSARPGCIIELDTINDATADWQNIQLLHVFQEALVTGQQHQFSASTAFRPESANVEDTMGAYVDLSRSGSFLENFYLVVLERLSTVIGDEGSRVHMWQITISSQPNAPYHDGNREKDYGSMDDGNSDEEEALYYHDSQGRQEASASVMKMSITTCKVCTQTLFLPTGVHVISANVAAGHLSSASIYPACFAPYLLTTACSDGQLRFWKCTVSDMAPSVCRENSLNVTNYEFSSGLSGLSKRMSTTSIQQWQPQKQDYEWEEWQMICSKRQSSSIIIPGKPITVSCAYNGRIAVAYRYGDIRAQPNHPEEKFINLYVAIFECESTGGSEWVLEDTIELKDIKIPDPQVEIELSQVMLTQQNFPPGLSLHNTPFSDIPGLTPTLSSAPMVSMPRTKSVPSLSTIQSVRKSIAEQGNKLGLLKQKCLVQLDWVATEDGSHILTVGVGTKIFTYTQVSDEVAQASIKANAAMAQGVRENTPTDIFHRPLGLMQKSKSLVIEDYQEEIRWMRLRVIELETADGLPPLPMHMSWVRTGILVVGMDNEIHVYTQWRGSNYGSSSGPAAGSSEPQIGEELTADKRTLTEANLASMASSAAISKGFKSVTNFKSTLSTPNVKHAQSLSLHKRDSAKRPVSGNGKDPGLSRSDSTNSLSVMHDFGLFEAARYANPVLPQYHPKQLTALLNFGKIRRVKAILAHLLRCIGGFENFQAAFVADGDAEDGVHHHGRTWSISLNISGGNPEDAAVIPDAEDFPDFLEVSSIPPLPIYALISADADNTVLNTEIANVAGTADQGHLEQDYTDLFNTQIVDETEELDLSSSLEDTNKKRRHQLSHLLANPYAFLPAHSKLLGQQLMRISLPGLSSLDQMYLVALADTVAHTKMDFADRFQQDDIKEGNGSLANDSQVDISQATESMDDCGLRFLLAVRQHIYLLSTLPPAQRAILQHQGLQSYFLVWAFHSEATEELLSMIPCMQKEKPTWDELRQFGAGWWVTNITVLRTMIEQVAKAAFQADKNPLDSALFYLAMRKKMVLWGLYRSVENQRMADFFKNDFTEDRWRKAALKNAFALLGKQMFREAAAFFLLGDSLKDAVEVLLDKTNDLQLALVICRLYNPEDAMPQSVRRLLYENILGRDENGENYSTRKALPDPFLRSMSFWMLKDYQAALQTLLEDNIGRKTTSNIGDPDTASTKPNIFNFYNYLRTHPLLLRLQLSAASLKKRRAILTGFTRANSVAVSDKITTIDRVTPTERRLFFATAHTHFKNGCPFLALEVLSKLPPVVEADIEKEQEIATQRRMSLIQGSISTGTLQEDVIEESDESSLGSKASNNDLSAPFINGDADQSNKFDWSQPLTRTNFSSNTADSFDWSTPLTNRVRFDDEIKLDLTLSSHSDEEEEDAEIPSGKHPVKIEQTEADDDYEDDDGNTEDAESLDQKIDIMAQQFKFVACLKVMMEELSTLATGFEVDGGQLRYQLYVWLEKEVEVLKVLCNYGQPEEMVPGIPDDLDTSQDSDDFETLGGRQRNLSFRSDTSRASLHEVILADKQDLESKERRLAKRKSWLKQNQHLLRTLISYSILQGSSGGGLASVRMELLLLLQELQQERPQQQLLSPLPFPTTLPLLSASLASSRTVIADPIQHLQGLTQDLLHSLIEMTIPPGATSIMAQVVSMRNLSVSLSSCIYQCLCDSDSFYVNMARTNDPGLEGFTNPALMMASSSLMAGIMKTRHRTDSANTDEVINTHPAKWPGVTSLHVLLMREKDEDAPKLHVMLCEALLAVYVTLLVTGLATYDPQILYRLLANKLDQQSWGALFGGGVKTVLKVEKNIPKVSGDRISQQRLKFNMRVMAPMKETYKERFVAPELSMISYFMTKPFISSNESIISYDSDDSVISDAADGQSVASDEEEEEEEEETERPKLLLLSGQKEHSDPSSYSWCLMRFAILRAILSNLRTFLPQVGIEITELPIVSPMLHALLRQLERWEAILQSRLDMFSCSPDNYIAGLMLDTISGMPGSKLQALFNPSNTPFIKSRATLPIKRLWFQLLRQENLQELFLRYVFRRSHKNQIDENDSMKTSSSEEGRLLDPMKVVHKEQDIITSFAINQDNGSILALATQKELVELDIGLLLRPPAWLSDDNEFDIETLRKSEREAVKEECSSQQNQEEKWLVVDVKSRRLNSHWMCTEEVKVAPFRSLRECGTLSKAPHVSRFVTQRKTSVACLCGHDVIVTCPKASIPESAPEFLVIHTPQDTPQPHSGSQTPSTPYAPSPLGSSQNLQTGRGASMVKSLSNLGVHNPVFSHCLLDRSRRLINVILRRVVSGVRRIGSHPTLSYYLTGSADGCVRLWEWGHGQPVATLRQPGTFPKVTKVLFNAQGNKCCISDIEGAIGLWQIGLGSNFNKPIMSLPCHNKTTSDFAFLGCSSLIATAGHSSESKNVCMWDTLLPPRSCLVHAFTCHEHGSPAVVYAPQRQLLISGGRKGEICIFDMRQRQLRHTFQAHESAIKCLTMDSQEEYFVTGSAEGDIKVWGLDIHQLTFSFPGEHSKNTFFRTVGSTSGVTQVAVGPANHLFSCGVDGSIKFRQLPEKEVVVHHWV